MLTDGMLEKEACQKMHAVWPCVYEDVNHTEFIHGIK